MKKRYRNIATPLVTSFAIIGMIALAVFANVAHAGPISLDTYYQFSFESAGSPAIGCDPADPAGPACIPSSGTPTTFLDAPPWTFSAPAGGLTLGVTDAFSAGDRFEIFNGGTSIGFTSAFNAAGDCSDDPVVCFSDANMSRGFFTLSEGSYSITIVPTNVAADLGGTGYLIAARVPEPTSVLLLAAAGIAGWTTVPRRRRTRSANS